MTKRTIVVVSDLDNSNHGEINVLDSPDGAARLVESLLESGYDSERIRVFTGDELEMQVTHRPVVTLKASDAFGAEEPEEDDDSTADPDREGADEGSDEETVSVGRISTAMAAPYVKDGIRFSTLFRPA